MTDSDLTIKAREIARCLTYNDSKIESETKHILREMAHRIDSKDIRVHKKKDGILIVNGIGSSRFMTFSETLMYKFFKVIPRKI